MPNRTLWLHALAMLAGVSVVHGYMVFAEASRITVMSALLLAGVAVYLAGFQILQAKALRQRRYGTYSGHLIAYLIVNGSYWLHAAVLVATSNSAVLDSTWQGALFGMSGFWGVGLAFHTLGAVMSRGFEDANV